NADALLRLDAKKRTFLLTGSRPPVRSMAWSVAARFGKFRGPSYSLSAAAPSAPRPVLFGGPLCLPEGGAREPRGSPSGNLCPRISRGELLFGTFLKKTYKNRRTRMAIASRFKDRRDGIRAGFQLLPRPSPRLLDLWSSSFFPISSSVRRRDFRFGVRDFMASRESHARFSLELATSFHGPLRL